MLRKCLVCFIIFVLVIGNGASFAQISENEENYIKIKHDRIYYERLGNEDSEKTIILIHGASGTGDSLKPLATCLTDYNVIVLDLPGHYRSEGEAEFLISEYSKFMKMFINQLRIDKIVTNDITLIGHSMGGGITLDTAINHNISGIKRVVITNSGAKFDTVTQEFVDSLKDGYYNPAFINACFTPYTEPAIIEFFMTNIDTLMASIEASYADFSAAFAFDESDKLHKVKVPTLILSGEMDMVTPLATSQELDMGIDNSELISYPKVGHMLPIEKPEIVAEDIINFIENN